jgi:glycosyltransferase involved in cell wall biosynthesis
MVNSPLSVVIPAFNEERAIGRVIQRLTDVLTRANISFELVVVDDGSSDRTAELAECAGARVLRHLNNRGYGASLKTGILAATHDTICIIDADGTYPPERIPDLLSQLNQADMVVGARIGSSVAIPWTRRPAKWLLNRLANFVARADIPDLNSGLRVFRRVAALQYFHILPDQFSFTTTITLAMHCDRYAVRYVPIDYGRRTGRSKVVAWDAVNFTVLILRLAMLFRPLRVFLPVALVCMTYSVGKGTLDLFRDHFLSATAVMSMLAGLQILLIGMLGEAIATRLWHLGSARYSGVLGGDSRALREPDSHERTNAA